MTQPELQLPNLARCLAHGVSTREGNINRAPEPPTPARHSDGDEKTSGQLLLKGRALKTAPQKVKFPFNPAIPLLGRHP